METTWIFPPSKLQRKSTWKNVDISTTKIKPKKVHENNVDFLTAKITSEKLRGNDVDFLTIEIATKKARGKHGYLGYLTSETVSRIFQPVKLNRKKYMETMWIFRSSKLCRKKFMETTWII